MIEAALSDRSKEVRVLQADSSSKCTLQIPTDQNYSSVGTIMEKCEGFCQEINKSESIELRAFVTKTDLEQTFLSYAANQKVNDTINN